MRKRFTKLLAGVTAVLMLATICTSTAFSADNEAQTDTSEVTEDTAAETAGDEASESEEVTGDEEQASEETEDAEEPEDTDSEQEAQDSETEATDEDAEVDENLEGLAPIITDEQALEMCYAAAENDNFIMYVDEANERVGLYVKANGYIHWSTPINAEADSTVKESVRLNQKASLVIKYGDVSGRRTSSYAYSYRESTGTSNPKTTYEKIDNGITMTFQFRDGFTIPVTYLLYDEYLEVSVDTDKIVEEEGWDSDAEDKKVLMYVQLTPQFSAATTEDEGYILVPDGSGAVIELNNGKQGYPSYSQKVYGRDDTIVPLREPAVTEDALLPVMAMVKGNNGLVAIATDGAANCTANANVSGKNSWYNNFFFEFEVRSDDNYYMGAGDKSAITVFQSGDIAIPRLAVRYYPIVSEDSTVGYTEIADIYRNYIIEEQGFEKKESADDPELPLYVSFYGGTLKEKSVLGFPIALRTAFTEFSDAQSILEELKELGVNDLVVNYFDWTQDSISEKIAVSAKPASCLGGKSDFNELIEFFKNNSIDYYFTLENMTFFDSGNGFSPMKDTAMRISKAYSRQPYYDVAFNVPLEGLSPALLSSASYDKLFSKITENYVDAGLPGVGFGSLSTTLISDFSEKYTMSREDSMNTLISNYSDAEEKIGKIYANSANAFLLPYVSRIADAPLTSSSFNIVDYDIPFYQMVIHGYVSYASAPMNDESNAENTFLRAVAAGSSLNYEFIAEDVSKTTGTDYEDLYYANYEGWLETAAKEYQLANEVLAGTSGETITEYVFDGNESVTTFSNGKTVTVNYEDGTIETDGKTYNYSEYVEGGAAD